MALAVALPNDLLDASSASPATNAVAAIAILIGVPKPPCGGRLGGDFLGSKSSSSMSSIRL